MVKKFGSHNMTVLYPGDGPDLGPNCLQKLSADDKNLR